MKLSSIEKAVNSATGASWGIVRDATISIIKQRKANANFGVRAGKSDKEKGVEIVIYHKDQNKKNSDTLANVWVPHMNANPVATVKELLEKFGYEIQT